MSSILWIKCEESRIIGLLGITNVPKKEETDPQIWHSFMQGAWGCCSATTGLTDVVMFNQMSRELSAHSLPSIDGYSAIKASKTMKLTE